MASETLGSDAKFVRVVLPVRFEDQQIDFDAPFRKGDVWSAVIDIETGRIEGWEQGQSLELYLKVVDEGDYFLLDSDQKVVGRIEGGYVPDMIPGQWGDYVDLQINEEGLITNWALPLPEMIEAFYE